MVSKNPYNHKCLTFGFQETFKMVNPGYEKLHVLKKLQKIQSVEKLRKEKSETEHLFC